MKAYQIIRAHIEKKGMKQNFVAEKIGMKPDLLNKSLDGKRKLQADEFIKICNVLSLDIKDFKSHLVN